VATRLALDHPEHVGRLVIMDGIPVLNTWNAATRGSRRSGGTGGSGAVSRPWVAGPLEGRPIESGHHVAQEAPDALAAELAGFLTSFRGEIAG
jgi:hypothetical protein